MYCKNCGHKLPDDAKFCTACGFRVEQIEKREPQKTEVRQPQKTEVRQPQKTEVRQPKKRTALVVVLVILAAAAITAAVCLIVMSDRNERAEISSQEKDESVKEDNNSGSGAEEKGSSNSAFSNRKPGKPDERSLFENKGKASYMIYADQEEHYYLTDSGGRVVSFDKWSYPTIEYLGDNGVLAGYAQNLENKKNELLLIKDGQISVISDKLDGNTDLVYQLSASGEKLVYRETDGSIYSCDTNTEESKKIYQDTYISVLSYTGSVITFRNGYISIGDEEPFWAATFAGYLCASDDAGHIYYNSAYRTSSGEKKEDGHYENEEYSVDFCEVSVPANYDPESHVFPPYETIMTSESIYTWILAHNADYSEILYEYDDDTYYYKDQEKVRLTSDALLYPIESLKDFYVHQWDNGHPSSVTAWFFEHYLNTGLSILDAAGDNVHSIRSFENHVYAKMDVSADYTISLVWMDDERNLSTLINFITGDPQISEDGTKIWCLSGDQIYCVDLSDGEPVVSSAYAGALSVPFDESVSYSLSYPIVISEDGNTAYYMTNSRYSNDFLYADLYAMNLDDMDSPRMIASGVSMIGKGPENKICYLADWDYEEQSASLYAYSETDDSKEQIAGNAIDFYMLNSSLFYVVVKEDLTREIRRLVSAGSSDLVAKNVNRITHYFNE